MAYIEIPVEVEPIDLAEEAFGYIEAQVPGWLPSPGNLEAWVIEANAQMASELREVEALVPDSIFAYFGGSILGLPSYAPVAATGLTTWTMVDGKGYTVDAGTLIAVTPAAATEAYAFQVVASFTVAAGATQATGVLVQAVEAGADASGITGAVEMLDPLDFVASVALEGATSGGTDAEEVDAYLDRLSDLLTLLSPRPILPQDFAVIAQREVPAVARAVAIDLYNASTQTSGVARCVTVVCVDANGNPCDALTKTTVDNLLQSMREVNFLVFVADATYTTIDVAFDVSIYPGFDGPTVVQAVDDALTAYLSPANWGLPPYGDMSARSWINDTKVRYLELAEVANRVEGVHYVKTLTFAVGGGTKATADITLTGVAPMPKPGAIAGTGTVET